jgi:hypothetical protein
MFLSNEEDRFILVDFFEVQLLYSGGIFRVVLVQRKHEMRTVAAFLRATESSQGIARFSPRR